MEKDNDRPSTRVLFAGGGTLGPVTPLLAVAEEWKRRDSSVEFVWVGTPGGPERATVEEAGIPFLTLPVARLTRYPSFEWLLLPINLVRAVHGAWSILKRERPSIIACAGGYTGVPLIVIGRLFGIPTWLHQQDARWILSSRLAMPFARLVTVAWEHLRQAPPERWDLRDHRPSESRIDWVGNPVRRSALSGNKERAVSEFGLDPSAPTLLVFGGGGGSRWINEAFGFIGHELAAEMNVIHVTGHGKLSERLAGMGGRYHAVEFLTRGMADALAAADAVVCRAGMGTITELAAKGLPAIVIPLPRSPQEDNGRALSRQGAAIVLDQPSMTPQMLLESIRRLVRSDDLREGYGRTIPLVVPTYQAGHIVDLLVALVK